MAKSLEQRARDRILTCAPFRMPLNGQGKTSRVTDIDRFGGSVRRMAIDNDMFAGPGDALTVKRIGHDFARAQNMMKDTALLKADRMTGSEDLIKAGIRRHAVIHPPWQIADFGIKRATKSDVHFLKSPADAEYGLPDPDTGPDERQGHCIPRPIERTMGWRFLGTIFRRMDVGAAARKKKTIAEGHDIFKADQSGIGRNDQRRCLRYLGHSLGHHHGAGAHLILTINFIAIADDSDDRAMAGMMAGIDTGFKKLAGHDEQIIS